MALGNQHSVTEWLEVAPGSFTAKFLPSSSWPFSILDVVQPVALQVRRPLVAVVSGGHRDRVWDGLCARLWVLLFLLLLLWSLWCGLASCPGTPETAARG